MQIFLGQDPRLQLRMKIETAIVSLLSALSFIQTLISVASHRDVNLLNTITDSIATLPVLEVDFSPTVKSLTDSHLSRMTPFHNISSMSSQRTVSEMSGSRPTPTFETSITSVSLDMTSLHSTQHINVWFGQDHFPYNADYAPFVLQSIFSYGLVETLKLPFNTIENIPKSVRTIWFWQEIARAQRQALAPTFISQMPEEDHEKKEAQTKMESSKPTFTLLQGQSPSTISDRVHELGLICGRTVFSFSLNEHIDYAKSLVPFIHGVVGGGKWALLENIDILPSLTLNAPTSSHLRHSGSSDDSQGSS
ncbi:hypothetical protein BLNAU_1551 [Blattamonas nauphoetae]|uniref:Uncharacterized protein n=1 Tax=Blattamonas nauphoetae TaxID=2049346 RepID=A0ABQ9YID0_9EUKA|nr:hypothetical protein BLNAU_1551 [Blattamonas nauphoetae]